MGVFSVLEDINTEELLRIVIDCDNRAEKRVQNMLAKNAPDYRWWIIREGAAMFRRKLQLHEPTVIVPRKLIPDNAQVMAVDKPQLRPEGVPRRQQKIVNLGRIWLDELPAPPPMPQAEVVPAEELGNAFFNYHEAAMANMARVVPIAEAEIYPDPF